MKIRQNDKVAGSRHAPGHRTEFFAYSKRVHVEEHDGKGSTLLGVRDEGVHPTFGRADIAETFHHQAGS
jgi:hypothetical protein